MPEDDFDKTGPYRRQGFVLLGRVTPTEWVELAEFVPRLEDCDRDQLVAGLNRGAHFYAMLGALLTARVDMARAYRDDSAEIKRLDAAIAEAKTKGA